MPIDLVHISAETDTSCHAIMHDHRNADGSAKITISR